MTLPQSNHRAKICIKSNMITFDLLLKMLFQDSPKKTKEIKHKYLGQHFSQYEIHIITKFLCSSKMTRLREFIKINITDRPSSSCFQFLKMLRVPKVSQFSGYLEILGQNCNLILVIIDNLSTSYLFDNRHRFSFIDG